MNDTNPQEVVLTQKVQFILNRINKKKSTLTVKIKKKKKIKHQRQQQDLKNGQ